MFIKIILATFLINFSLCLNINAQSYYKCIANKVAVKEQPSSRAATTRYQAQGYYSDPLYFHKNDIVKYKGKKRNGYMFVQDAEDYFLQEGWVPVKYFTPAVRCGTCKGKGRLNVRCPECNGAGCPVVSGGGRWCLDGYKYCSRCDGAGYR